MDALRDILQAKYCPPLDTALLTTLVADLEAECKAQNASKPSKDQLVHLESTLAILAEQQNPDADAAMFSNQMSPDTIFRSLDCSSEDTLDLLSADVATTSCSDASETGQTMSSNPISQLFFLQTLFPLTDVAKLRDVIARSGTNGIDVETMEELLTNDFLLEIEEKDFLGVEVHTEDRTSWDYFGKKNRGTTDKKSLPKPTKIIIADVRQRQNQTHSPRSPSAPAEPWIQISSIATHLSTLLPNYPAHYFQSVFHNPNYPTPAMALRSCLMDIANNESPANRKLSANESLSNLLEIIQSRNLAESGSDQKEQFMSDAKVAFRAARGNPNLALEIVDVLISLSTELDLGVYHSPAPTPRNGSPTKSRHVGQLPSAPPPIALPSISKTPARRQADPHEWQHVPHRKIVQESNALDAFIPAYNSGNKVKIKGTGNAIGKGGKGDVAELAHRNKIAQLQNERSEILREAARYYKNGNAANMGGQAAIHYAERARDIQIEIHKEKLEAARAMVMCNRTGDTVDLHGTTVPQAIDIVRELLQEESWSPEKPLTLITGKGTHSARQTGVLKPAVSKVLSVDGWDFHAFDSGLIVRGRR